MKWVIVVTHMKFLHTSTIIHFYFIVTYQMDLNMKIYEEIMLTHRQSHVNECGQCQDTEKTRWVTTRTLPHVHKNSLRSKRRLGGKSTPDNKTSVTERLFLKNAKQKSKPQKINNRVQYLCKRCQNKPTRTTPQSRTTP